MTFPATRFFCRREGDRLTASGTTLDADNGIDVAARLSLLDMLSFGPSISGAHSPDERVSISSVEDFYKLLTTMIEEDS